MWQLTVVGFLLGRSQGTFRTGPWEKGRSSELSSSSQWELILGHSPLGEAMVTIAGTLFWREKLYWLGRGGGVDSVTDWSQGPLECAECPVNTFYLETLPSVSVDLHQQCALTSVSYSVL